MADLPQVGLEAVIENLAGFMKGARSIEEAFEYVARAEAKVAKESPEAAAAVRQMVDEFVKGGGDIRDVADIIEESMGEIKTPMEEVAQLLGAGAIQQVAGSLARTGDQMVGLAKDAVMTAARIEELDLVLGNLAEQNDLSADAMREQVEAIRAQGIQADVAYGLVTQFVQANLDLSKASELARLAQDAAVISMEDSSQALAGLVHGITTLQPEMLRYRGIIVDLQGEYKRWADAHDRSILSLTSMEKQQIALDAALAQGSEIAGTYESAMESASKQLRSMPRYIADLKAEMGESLLPVYSDAIFATKDLLKWMGNLPPTIKSVVAATGTLTGGLFKATGAMVSTGAQIAQLVIGLQALKGTAAASALAFLGPLGLVAALVAVAGVGVATYIKAQEKAHRDEAAAILESNDKYENYILQIKGAELGSYAMSESLYEMVKAAQAAGDALTAAQLVDEMKDLQTQLMATTGLDWLDEFVNKVRGAQFSAEGWENILNKLLPTLTDLQLKILEDDETLEMWAKELDLSATDTEILKDVTHELVDAQQLLRTATDASAVSMGDHEERMLGLVDATQAATDAQIAYRTAMANSGRVLDGQVEREYELLAARLKGQAELKEYMEAEAERAKAEKEAAKEAERAEQERVRAQEAALQEMQRNEEAYGREVTNLYDSIVAATERAMADRQAAEEQYARDILELEEELAEQRAEIEQALARDLEDMRREYAQDREDAERDLARDLVDLAADLAEKNKATWQNYYDELESLAEQHGQRMKDIEQKYADLRAGVEEKYRTEKTDEELRDEEREALMAHLEELQRLRAGGMTGIDYTQAIADTLAQLDELKQEELDALAEAQAEEAAQEEAAYQAEREKAAQRRQEQLDANQEWYDQQEEQRQLAYERELEDLKIANERAKAERERAAQQAIADLDAQGAQRRAALAAQHQEELASIQANLSEELAAFRSAYVTQLWDLDTYLNSRLQKWRDHQAAVEALLGISSPSKWMKGIGEQLSQGLEVGFGKNPLVDAMGAFKQQTVQAAVPPQVAAAAGGASSVDNSRSYTLSYTGQPQGEASIRSLLTLMEMRANG